MNKELTIESIREKYKNVWVVVEVTQHDRYNVPVAGKVLFHCRDREEVYDNGFNRLKQDPKIDMYLFFTGDPVPENRPAPPLIV